LAPDVPQLPTHWACAAPAMPSAIAPDKRIRENSFMILPPEAAGSAGTMSTLNQNFTKYAD
jgi:hypothetical protein